MGCTASKSTSTVVVPMPDKSKENVAPKRHLKDKEADSLRGSQSSVRSCSTASRSDREIREASAGSTRTTDSGVGELEEDNIITEHSSQDDISHAKVNERPSTPDLSINGTPLKRRKSPKERLMSSLDNNNNNNNLNSLPPMGIIERPQSRGGMAFNVMLETGNVKRKPLKLMQLEKKKRRSKRRTKAEIEDKIKQAAERKKEHDNQVIEKATISRKEKQLREAKAMDEFAQRLAQQES